MSRLSESQLSFADLELQWQGVHLDPTLQGIADLLEQHSALVELVRQDLERGLKKPNAGRHGITPAQTLRSLTLMRMKNWDYRALRDRINDGYTLRIFTQFDSHAVPNRGKLRNIGYGVRSDFELNFGRHLPGFGQLDDDETNAQPQRAKAGL